MEHVSHKPLVIGITGGIGSGKSHVRQVLVSLGAEGIDADRVAHEVMQPTGPAYPVVVAEFGPEIVAADGQIDRAALGRRVFADPAALARLEAIVHPWVGRAIAAQVAASQAPAVVIEAIKLLEAGLSRQLCDQVWVTVCSPEAQFARLAASRGMSIAEVERRLAHQMRPEQMLRQADRVIDTSGTLAETAIIVCEAWADLGLPLPTPTLRTATPDDAEAIAAVWRAIVAEGGLTVVDPPFTVAQERAYLEQLSPRGRQTVAVVGQIVVGFQSLDPYATFTRAMDHVGVLGTFVLRPWRGRGLGRRLTEATLAHARQVGFAKFVVAVRADNPGAQAFYRALGFQPCGRLTRQAFVDGRYVDELLFEMFLD